MIAAESEEKIDEIIGKFEEEFELKIVGTMNEGILSTDILGLDLDYDRNKGEATLSLESYLNRIAKNYPDLIDKNVC
ncbi:hypothetical protein DAKH74_050910 [Maudiozyma humilis]|uniref:Uncharacterized protein n=1 Tax=Maudiozyma humilis TaxID=51915 RepID=A0AAV5S7Q1_MAUHU|nr:hypothetical protein DAKH74_050910 [Kazachstania humilis]